MRKIIAVTGSRADYGILRSVLYAIRRHKSLKVSLIVTCMHLDEQFGYTLEEIKKDGFAIAGTVDILTQSDTLASMAQAVGRGIIGIAEILKKKKPDILLVNTDRFETLAAAIAGAFMNIPVAHMHGGEVSGSIDESIRHAITKFAHIHFPSTKENAKRIIRLGEDPKRVFVVGAAGLGFILSKKLLPPKAIFQKYKLDSKRPIFLVVQHPVTTEVGQSARQIRQTLEAITEIKEQTVIIYPNADAGGRAMIRTIKKYLRYSFIKAYKSLPHLDYLSLMRVAKVMIGNSSSGIIEAPSFKLPVVNIGTRQDGRQRASNVIDVGYNKKEILVGIHKALYERKFLRRLKKCINPYGDGKAGARIAKLLNKIKISEELLNKKITY
jgi:UDP-N-acetylglucosamine 2-epimerase (non-hydrolysing)/GDP/UDP-N,N'-diacetylbacillosamine 2-epimerase (hydrolysing)